MSVGFYYPTKSAPTAQWVPSAQPVFPLSEPVDYPLQLTGQTAGGALYVQDKGTQQATFRLEYKGVTETDRDNALTFFTAVKKSFYNFEYEDRDGVLTSVRWMNGFSFELVMNQRYDAVIELRKEV